MSKAKSVSELARSLTSSEKRSNIRFEPDPGTMAWIDVKSSSKRKPFEPSLLALVAEESHRGCGLVLKMVKDLHVGSTCRVKVGNSAPMRAEVRWRVELDSQIIRIGVMYLDL